MPWQSSCLKLWPTGPVAAYMLALLTWRGAAGLSPGHMAPALFLVGQCIDPVTAGLPLASPCLHRHPRARVHRRCKLRRGTNAACMPAAAGDCGGAQAAGADALAGRPEKPEAQRRDLPLHSRCAALPAPCHAGRPCSGTRLCCLLQPAGGVCCCALPLQCLLQQALQPSCAAVGSAAPVTEQLARAAWLQTGEEPSCSLRCTRPLG